MNQINLDIGTPTPLCKIMGKYGSDKGSENIINSWHNYTTFYHKLFKDIRDKPVRIFELGLGSNNVDITSNMGKDGKPGASLYGWAEYFPKAKVYGADIDSDILFSTDRINTYYCDQTKPDIIMAMWEQPELAENMDIIIEDGLHTFPANVCFFENSIHKLRKGGCYIIEDVFTKDIPKFTEKVQEWKNKYPRLLFNIISIPSHVNKEDNNLVCVFYA
jgi:trans-aconitate methyltransferase